MCWAVCHAVIAAFGLILSNIQDCVHAPGASVAQSAAKAKVNYAEMEANTLESDDEELVMAKAASSAAAAAADDGFPLHPLHSLTPSQPLSVV